MSQTKEEKKERARQYYEINKAKIRNNRILWDLKNKEKIKEQQKQYKINNKEKISKYRNLYLKNNPHIVKKWLENNKDKRKIVDKNYKMNNVAKVRNYKLKKKYGISLDEYIDTFNNQNGKCIICNKHRDDLNKDLCVDHNHITGKVRGLLCDKCNRGLGHFDDNIDILLNAIEYLKKHN